ncbi:hypothetical protein [Marinobacter sp. CA1]|uniref:hypothetical protein n=1 Tax=Marinobacter sp. CA1 TaxID=2817656 RepID=UPI001D0727FD|nr:hypothetical protein [Marinobacter sp. CA1]UDL04010.1 hypothetical protein J2887_14980 [Marinobacter sp. CA1]
MNLINTPYKLSVVHSARKPRSGQIDVAPLFSHAELEHYDIPTYLRRRAERLNSGRDAANSERLQAYTNKLADQFAAQKQAEFGRVIRFPAQLRSIDGGAA